MIEIGDLLLNPDAIDLASPSYPGAKPEVTSVLMRSGDWVTVTVPYAEFKAALAALTQGESS